MPAVALVGGDHSAVVLVLVVVEDAASDSVVIVAVVIVVAVVLVVVSVIVQRDGCLHADRLPSRVDAQRLVLPTRPRAEAGATVTGGIGRHASDGRTVGGDIVAGRGTKPPHHDGERGVEAAAKPSHDDAGATARARRSIRRRQVHADARGSPGRGDRKGDRHRGEERHGAPLHPDRCHARPPGCRLAGGSES